jgi:glycosyltransferase involved in cell wall biosynthesis
MCGIAGIVDFDRPPDRDPLNRMTASSSDGTSASLLEALAAGLVPVVSRIRANESWIRDGENGFLFEVVDPADLAMTTACDRMDVRERARKDNPALVRARADSATTHARMVDLLATAAGSRS